MESSWEWNKVVFFLQNYDDEDDYIKDEPQSLALSDDVTDCSPVPDVVLTGFCQKKMCSSHDDCHGKNRRCCFNGCVKTCMKQPDPPPCTPFVICCVLQLIIGIQSGVIEIVSTLLIYSF